MVRHIVLFRLKEDLAPEKRKEVMETFKKDIEALPAVIPFIRFVEVGFNINPGEQWDLCLNSEFDSLEQVKEYATNPHHVRVAGALKPFLSGRSCTDYEFS